MRSRGIRVDLPTDAFVLRRAVFDFNGTLAVDGRLLDGVAARLRRLAKHLEITVMTADTFGTVRQACRGLPVSVEIVRTGADKQRFVRRHGRGVVAVGNGRNDVPMFNAATLAIAVLGPEGTASAAIRAASIVVADVRAALDLLLRPTRAVATLRP